jgi:hypothetical protein
MMAFSSKVNYIWEPFNLKYRAGVPDYYPHIGDETGKEKRKFYDKLINDTIQLKNLNPIITVNPGDSMLKRIGKKFGINRTTFLWYTLPKIKKVFFNPSVLVLKDPIGIFMSGYLVKEHNFKIIATIRHPAAVTISRKKLKWAFDFDCWRNQVDLYEGHFKKIDDDFKKSGMDFIHETSLHWLTCYSYLQKIKELHPDKVMIIRHEDLCENPVNEMEKVFNFIDLKYEDKVIDKIKEITSGSELEKSTLNLAKLEKRDGKKLIFKWKREISQCELDAIKELTKPASSIYYGNNEFWKV